MGDLIGNEEMIPGGGGSKTFRGCVCVCVRVRVRMWIYGRVRRT